MTWKSIIHTKEESNSSLSKDNFLRAGKKGLLVRAEQNIDLRAHIPISTKIILPENFNFY